MKGGQAADPVTAYARAVVAGEIVAGPHVRNAARRHLADLEHGASRGLVWDIAAVDRAIRFFPTVLRLSQSFSGQSFELHDSQKFIVGALFGWKLRDGRRRFRRAYIEIAKGNGKSPLAAGIGMYMLLADGERNAEVYAAASVKAQAMVIFRAATEMYRQSPALSERLTPSGGNPIWNLADLKTGSFFRPISSEESFSGPMPSCALCDEIHEHRSRDAIEMLERGFKSRRQPLLLMITNSGSDRQSVCWEEHCHAVRVAAGSRTAERDPEYVGEVIDDRAFAYVSGLDAGDQPLDDPACWPKANPLLGVSMPVSEIEVAVAQAKAIPGRLNGVLRLHFCEWTDAETAWMSRAALEAVLADFDPAAHFGKKIWLSADLSATRDLTAMGFVVRTGSVELERVDKDGTGTRVTLPTFDAWVEVWSPADTLTERALQDQAPYDVWAREGHLTATPGQLVRMDFVAARAAEAQHEYDVQALAYDAYAFRKNLEPEIDQLGVTIPLVEHPQGGKRKAAESGLWMPGSVAELELLILEKRIRIRRSPPTISAIMSAVVESDPFNNRWFSKRKATGRIDALVALAMAVGVATGAPEPEKSIWDRPDLWN